MKMSCDNARVLVPSYLDGELSLEQAHPLREHLMDCRSCREVAKDGKTLARWFVDTDPAGLVPAGFAARVARRAFAGDPGTGETPSAAELNAPAARGNLLPFLLKCVTVAAAILFVLAAGIQRLGLPPSEDLRAQPAPPWERPGAVPAPELPEPKAEPSDEPDPAEQAPTTPLEGSADGSQDASESLEPGTPR